MLYVDFELKKVFEYENGECTAVDMTCAGCLDDGRALKIFYTIYGIKEDGTSEALIDREDYRDAKKILDFFTDLIDEYNYHNKY